MQNMVKSKKLLIITNLEKRRILLKYKKLLSAAALLEVNCGRLRSLKYNAAFIYVELRLFCKKSIIFCVNRFFEFAHNLFVSMLSIKFCNYFTYKKSFENLQTSSKSTLSELCFK